MNIDYISVSRESLWRECKYRYKLRYHLKIPSPEPEPYYFEYGKIVHTIAEYYVAYKGERNLGDISRSVLDGSIELEEGMKISKKVPQSHVKKLGDHLRAIYTLTKQIGFDGEVERPFFLDLDPPNEIMVKGVIDRLIPKKGKYFILDYKTTKKGKWRKTVISIKKDLQLRTYTWAVHKILNVPIEDIKAALYYVEGADLIPVTYTRGQISEAVKCLVSVYHEIKEADPDTVLGNVGDHCSRCDYRNMCPFVRNTRR